MISSGLPKGPGGSILAPLIPSGPSEPPKKKSGSSKGPLRLVGNLGTSVEVEPLKLTTLAEAQVEGTDAHGTGSPGIAVTMVVLGDTAAIGAMLAIVQFGSGGMQGGSGALDINHGMSFTVPGDWVRVSVLVSGGNLRIGAFTNLASHRRADIFFPSTTTGGALAVGATDTFDIPPFAQDVRVFSANPLLDSFELKALVQGGAVTSTAKGPVSGGAVLPIVSRVRSLTLTNTGVAAMDYLLNIRTEF